MNTLNKKTEKNAHGKKKTQERKEGGENRTNDQVNKAIVSLC